MTNHQDQDQDHPSTVTTTTTTTTTTSSLPETKITKIPAEDGKVYYSYADIHDAVSSLVPKIRNEFQPTVMIAIGGGGFIPARMLRTELKIPILAISLELYDDTTNSINEHGVICHQWFDEQSVPGKLVKGGNVLVVDEVDDSRTTLQYAVEQVLMRCQPSKLGVCVVHNKRKEKRGILPPDVAYYAAENVLDHWNCYPWDAAEYGRSIHHHEQLARQCSSSCHGSSSNHSSTTNGSCNNGSNSH